MKSSFEIDLRLFEDLKLKNDSDTSADSFFLKQVCLRTCICLLEAKLFSKTAADLEYFQVSRRLIILHAQFVFLGFFVSFSFLSFSSSLFPSFIDFSDGAMA